MVDQRLKDKPYLIDAIIGNSSILASLGANGRMYRAWWPHIDTPQHIDSIRMGIELEDQGSVTWFDDEAEGWKHVAAYVNRSNIFLVQASSDSVPLDVDSLHFVVPDKDLIVREYTFTNTGDTAITFSIIMYSSMIVGEHALYTTTMFEPSADALVHYKQRTYLVWGSSMETSRYHAGISLKEARGGAMTLMGSQIEMTTSGALAWRFELVEPGESVVLPLYLACGSSLEEAVELLQEARERTSGEWYEETKQYWDRYLDSLKSCPLEDDDVRELYERSLLMFPLMSDAKTGSIIAAPEFDEHFTRCGGYGYCWGRDAAFITTALDKAGLIWLSDRYYDWTLTAQSPDGSWQQRHYHDGSLAPSWGLQIDEGASIIWGMYQHYRR
jgi:GH15 family glucan-1,4-alpha-glucosidase